MFYSTFIKVTSLDMEHSYDCPHLREVTLKDVDEADHYLTTTVQNKTGNAQMIIVICYRLYIHILRIFEKLWWTMIGLSLE